MGSAKVDEIAVAAINQGSETTPSPTRLPGPAPTVSGSLDEAHSQADFEAADSGGSSLSAQADSFLPGFASHPSSAEVTSTSGASPAQATRLLSGFDSHPPSPYHFGGALPQGAIKSSPPPAPALGGPVPPQGTSPLGISLSQGSDSLDSISSTAPRSMSTSKGVAHIRKHARTVPDIPSCRSRWQQAIRSLMSRPSSNQASLYEAWEHIRDGVSAGIVGRPAEGKVPNSRSVSLNLPACKQRLHEYAVVNALKELSSPPPVCHPLLAVIKDGKKPRLCLDLSRNYNDLVEKRKFKLLAFNSAVAWSEPGCFYGKLDLSSCFLSFPLSPESAADMCFEFERKFFQFTSMPFGLASAPRIASMLLDVVSSVLHEAGIRHIRYLDDFLFIARTEADCMASMLHAAQVIKDFGLVSNPDKVEGPSQRMEFLGLILDSIKQTSSVSDSRMVEVKALLVSALECRRPSRKQLLSLLGKLSFIASVLPAARPFLRSLIDAAHFRSKFDGKARRRRHSTGFKDDARFWLSHLERWNGTQRWIATSLPFVLASDASTEGWGWAVEAVPGPLRRLLPPALQLHSGVSGYWGLDLSPVQWSHKHIAFGELFVPCAAVILAGAALRDSHVVFIMDNAADVAIINRRKTKDPRLLSLLRVLARASVEHNFAFTAIHRPGVKNCLPDVLSRAKKHLYRLDPEQLTPALLKEEASSLAPRSGATPTHTHSYGSFFNSDPITLAASADRLLIPSRTFLISSSSLSSLMEGVSL